MGLRESDGHSRAAGVPGSIVVLGGGIALSGVVFFTFHHLHLLLGGGADTVAAALAVLLAGWGLGSGLVPHFWQPGRRGSRLLAAAALLLCAFWGLWPPGGNGWIGPTVALAMAWTGLLGRLFGGQAGQQAAHP